MQTSGAVCSSDDFHTSFLSTSVLVSCQDNSPGVWNVLLLFSYPTRKRNCICLLFFCTFIGLWQIFLVHLPRIRSQAPFLRELLAREPWVTLMQTAPYWTEWMSYMHCSHAAKGGWAESWSSILMFPVDLQEGKGLFCLLSSRNQILLLGY